MSEPLRASDPREVGGYVLESRLGAGGMGTVYLARDAAYLVLQPDDRNCQNVMSMFFDRLPYLRPGLEYPPGRGVFSAGRTSTVVQVPLAGDRL